MITASQLKTGTTFEIDGTPYKVLKYRHQKIGRGGANVILSIKNLKTGTKEEKTYNSSVKVEPISTVKRPLQFLYNDGSNAVFMDSTTYEQVEVPTNIIQDEIPYLKEGEIVDVLFWEDKVLSVDIPPKVVLTVADTAPGVKGNSATNIYKPDQLENGVDIKVPLFIKIGDRIKVDTRTGEYVERTS